MLHRKTDQETGKVLGALRSFLSESSGNPFEKDFQESLERLSLLKIFCRIFRLKQCFPGHFGRSSQKALKRHPRSFEKTSGDDLERFPGSFGKSWKQALLRLSEKLLRGFSETFNKHSQEVLERLPKKPRMIWKESSVGSKKTA